MREGVVGLLADGHELVQRFVEQYPDLEASVADIRAAALMWVESWNNGGTLFTLGNGGSGADAEHVAAELLKGFLQKRPLPAPVQQRLLDACVPYGQDLVRMLQGGLRTVALLGSGAFFTAFANDVDARFAFAQLMHALGRGGDCLFAISTSGTSENVVAALAVARALSVRTVGLTGRTGGAMGPWCDVCIRVPAEDTARVQELHRPVYHLLCALVEDHFFGAASAREALALWSRR